MDDNSGNKRGEILLNLIAKFSSSLSNMIDGGKGNDLIPKFRLCVALSLGVKELYGGARIGFVFNEVRLVLLCHDIDIRKKIK